MKTPAFAFVLACAITLPASSEGATIRVPADAASIQRAIDASAAGDTVLVSPATYVENITFRGKTITVESEQGPSVTIIDGGGAGSVVTFASGENRSAVLRGFTIRNGLNSFSGGGVLIQNSSPSIIGNAIVGNGACSGGGLWMVNFSQATIAGNLVVGNAAGCGGGFFWAARLASRRS